MRLTTPGENDHIGHRRIDAIHSAELALLRIILIGSDFKSFAQIWGWFRYIAGRKCNFLIMECIFRLAYFYFHFLTTFFWFCVSTFIDTLKYWITFIVNNIYWIDMESKTHKKRFDKAMEYIPSFLLSLLSLPYFGKYRDFSYFHEFFKSILWLFFNNLPLFVDICMF